MKNWFWTVQCIYIYIIISECTVDPTLTKSAQKTVQSAGFLLLCCCYFHVFHYSVQKMLFFSIERSSEVTKCVFVCTSQLVYEENLCKLSPFRSFPPKFLLSAEIERNQRRDEYIWVPVLHREKMPLSKHTQREINMTLHTHKLHRVRRCCVCCAISSQH